MPTNPTLYQRCYMRLRLKYNGDLDLIRANLKAEIENERGKIARQPEMESHRIEIEDSDPDKQMTPQIESEANQMFIEVLGPSAELEHPQNKSQSHWDNLIDRLKTADPDEKDEKPAISKLTGKPLHRDRILQMRSQLLNEYEASRARCPICNKLLDECTCPDYLKRCWFQI